MYAHQNFDPLLVEFIWLFDKWFGSQVADKDMREAMSDELWDAWVALTKKRKLTKKQKRFDASIRIIDRNDPTTKS